MSVDSDTLTDATRVHLGDQLQIDALCDRFEAAWRSGQRPDLSGALNGAEGPARVCLFRELLALELEFRRKAGECPEAGEYRARFPEFAALVDAAFRDDQTRLASRVPARDGASTSPGPHAGLPWGESSEQLADALRSAGYEIIEELGRGGMGVVYRAYQPELGRDVALKLIRSADFASASQRSRFQNEAEAVAQLDHPQIVPVFEVGESRGLDYFSMKLIAGTSLDRRLDEFSRDPRAAARLLATVAEAIHHAHQRGILHRDLKPANILVDQRGLPHVTDFGLARRLEGDGDLTLSGAVMGTPSYMSPEQATGRKEALTTATDVYGLGAILYALLTGKAPHAGTSYVEVLDQVRARRPEPPSRSNPRVPRDLEVICLKCLEKEPGRRYTSAQALAEDLGRWLSGRPIAARPARPARRAWMWCRRHPLPAALSGLLVLSVAAGFVGVTWKWREAENALDNYAAIEEFLGRMIAEGSPEVNPHSARFTVREMLDRAAARMGGDVQGRPKVEAAVREQVGRAYLALGEYDTAEPLLRTALGLDRDLYGPRHPATLRATNGLAAVVAASGRAAEAEALLRRNRAAAGAALGPDAEITLEAESQLGVLLRKRKALEESEALLRHALDGRRRVLPPDHPDTLRSARELCLLCLDLRRYDEAEALADAYERGIRCARGPKHPDNVAALANRGLIRRLQGSPDQAEPFYRRAVEEARRILGPEHPLTRDAADEHARLVRELESRPDRADRAPRPSAAAPPF